ncbi:hypothetical protein H0H93_006491, partial [Arthromyces matolae]
MDLQVILKTASRRFLFPHWCPDCWQPHVNGLTLSIGNRCITLPTKVLEQILSWVVLAPSDPKQTISRWSSLTSEGHVGHSTSGKRFSFSHGDPMKLLGVCKLWRSFVISTPSFWSTINIRWQMNHGRTSPFLPNLLNIWMKNSKSSLLDIYIDAEHREWDPIQLKVLARLAMESRRWKTFSLRLNLPAPKMKLPLVNPFPHLESFQIARPFGVSHWYMPESGFDNTKISHYRAAHKSRRLKRVVWDFYTDVETKSFKCFDHLRCNQSAYPLPLGQLTEIHMRASLTNLLDVLLNAKNLITIEFSEGVQNYHAFPAMNWPRDVKSIPQLKNLTIASPDPAELIDILKLPGLVSLNMHCSPVADISKIADLLERSGAYLEAFRLVCTQRNPGGVVNLLRSPWLGRLLDLCVNN